MVAVALRPLLRLIRRHDGCRRLKLIDEGCQ
jgi:hypothetical protein